MANLNQKIESIEERNARVENDKAWEISWTRRIVVFVITYIIAGLWFGAIGVGSPWLNALVPAGAYILSTLTLPIIKNWWLKKIHTEGRTIEKLLPSYPSILYIIEGWGFCGCWSRQLAIVLATAPVRLVGLGSARRSKSKNYLAHTRAFDPSWESCPNAPKGD